MECVNARTSALALALAAILGSFGAFAAQADAATVVGSLRAPGVVWIGDGSNPAPVAGVMRNAEKAFVPEVLVIPAGSTVSFPNDDPIFHSIYSAGGPDPFDLGFYGNGPGKEESFPGTGVLDVGCHIHPQMHAVIIVVDGPSTQTDDRNFVLANVLPGKHVLHAWSAAFGERTASVTVPAGRGSVLNLEHPL